MKKKKKKISKNQYQYFLTLVALGTCGSLLANPEGLHLVSGDASSSNPASHILEITSGKKAIIEWDSFSIANHEVTRFIQQDSSSAVLNRVTGDMSKILGTLESNGKVFLINPKGIIVGEGARIDTGSFIASTFDILNADFLEGKELLFSGDSEHAIINLGTIRAEGGDVILLAHRIKNEGVITAPEGQVSLNSGSELLLQPGSSKVFIRPKLSKNVSKEIGIENTGTIQAVEAHLKADGNLFAHAINHTGVIEATGIENRNGRIHLVAENSKVDISGSMTASSGESGGEIHVISNQINLLDNAKLDVSGLANGGEILIGGDAHGDNPLTVPHASFTTMSEKATITASSLSKGSGGKVVLWADENTDFYGKIVAKGGPLGGDGGFVEISSPNTITFKGRVDLSAPLGADGHLLLDPGDISIGLGGTPNCCINFCSTPSVSLPNVSTTIIANSDLNAALQTCNVTLDTSSSSQSQIGNIDIGSLGIPQSHTLTLRANGNINIFTLLQINPTGTPINGDVLVLEAQGDIRLIPAVGAIPAAITHTGTGGNISISCDNLLAQGGANPSAQAIISMNSAGITPKNLTINAVGNTERGGNITLRGGTNSAAGGGGDVLIASGSSTDTISITASNTLELNSNDSIANISSNGPIILNAQTISLIGEGIAGSSAEITGSGISSINLTANTLSISTSGSTRGSISTVNGNISGTLQNLTIQPMGSQNNTISTSGTGNISLTNNQNDGTYLLAGNGTGTSMINTQSGTISLEFQGFNSGLSLLGLNSPAQILRTGPAVGNITITGTNGEAFLLVNGVLDTPILSSASIENRSGNIIVNFPGANSEILVGSNNVSSTSFIQTTTNAGDIIITQNNGILTLQGGNGSASNAGIQTTVSGQIEIIGSGLNVNLFGGTGALSDAFISPTSSPTTITASSLSLVGGIGDVSSAYINPFTSGNITIIAPTVLLQGGSGSLFCPAAINIKDSTSTIGITASNSLSILGGGSTGHNTAFISSDNAANANPLNLSLGGLLIEGGHGDTTDAFITSTGSPITITGTGPNDLSLKGGIGSSSSALIKSFNGAVTVNAPNQNLILAGNSGASSFATIESSSGFPLHVTVNNLTMTGGSGSTSSAGLQTLATGALTITANGNISLTGGSGDVDSSAFGIARGGALTITANGNLSLQGGPGANGFANLATVSSGSPEPLTIECANLSLIGSPTGSGIGFASIGTNLGDITIDAKGFILLESGNGTHTYTQITSNQGSINIGQNIPSFGNLSLYAGGGFNSYAQISTQQGNVQIGQTARSFGDLSLFGGNGSGAYAQISTLHGNIVTVNSGGNVILKGGNSPAGGISDASINGAANFVGGSLSLAVTGNSLSLEGGTGAGTGSNQAYLLADVSGSGNTVNINMSGDIDLTAGDGFGTTNAFIRSASGGGNNVTINCANLSLQGSENPLTPSGFASITSATGTTTINSSGSISLIGGTSEIGSSYALIDVEFHGIVAINAANNIHIEGGFGLDSNAEITSNSIAGASGSISITSNSLQLIGGGSPINSMAQANIAILNDVGNITINCQSTPGFIILQGGTGAGNNSVSIQADNGSLTMSGSTLSVVGGDGTGNANASIFTSSVNNPILLNFSSDVNISGVQSPYSANGLSNASITTSSTGAASPITITSANLSLLGSPSGSGQGSASIVTNVGGVSITSTGNLQLISGNAPVSFTKIQTTEGTITLSASGNVHLQGGTGTTSQSQIIRLGSTGDTTITSGSLILSGGVGSSSFAQIGTNIPVAFPFTGNISFPSVSGDVTVTGGHLGGYALIGHGSPSASTTGIHFTGNITFSSVAGNVYVSGGIQEPSFGQIGHVNSTSNSSTLSGNISITGARDVTVVNGGAPGYALIGMGGQSNIGTDSFTSDISITANNVSLQSQGLSEFTVGGYSVIGFLSPGSGIVTIHSTNLNIQTTQDISRFANTPTIQPVAGIGSYVLSTSNASSATITNLTLNPRLNFRFTLDNSPSQYSDGIDFVGTYFSQNSLATGSSSITITAGRNFFFDEYMLGLANQGFLQNTNPKNISTHLPIEITVGNGFYTSQGAGNTMSVISSGTLSVNDPSNPRGDVIISNLMQSSSGMEIIAGMNLILGNFAILNNTTSGNINLVADNLDPTAPDFNPAYGFTLITPATVTNQNNTGKIYIYSTTEFSTFIGDGKTPSLNGNVFVHGPELGNTDTEKWGVYFPTIIASPSSYTVYYKNTEPTPRPPGPTPSQIAFLKILSFDHYDGNFLISQMLYPQPEILDDYLFWAEAFSTAYDMKKYEKVRKSWGYRSSYDVFQKRKYILDRNKYFNFYELLLQRDVQIKR